jgi:hypothetical protein
VRRTTEEPNCCMQLTRLGIRTCWRKGTPSHPGWGAAARVGLQVMQGRQVQDYPEASGLQHHQG